MNEKELVIELEENVKEEIKVIVEKFNAIEETSIEIAIRISELVEGKERKVVGMIYNEFGELLNVKRSTLSTLKRAGDIYRKNNCLLDVPYTIVALIPDDIEVNADVSELLHNHSQREIKKEFNRENEVEGESSNYNIKTYSTTALGRILKSIISNIDSTMEGTFRICGKTLHIEGEVCYFE